MKFPKSMPIFTIYISIYKILEPVAILISFTSSIFSTPRLSLINNVCETTVRACCNFEILFIYEICRFPSSE